MTRSRPIEKVIATCDMMLKRDGAIPSGDAIVKEIGGSKVTAYNGQKIWISDLSDRLNRIQGMPPVPASAASAFVTMWEALTKANEADFATRAKGIEQQLALAHTAVSEAQADKLTAETLRATAETQLEEAKAAYLLLERQLVVEQGRRQEIENQVKAAQDQVTEAQRSADESTKTLQAIVDRAQERYEGNEQKYLTDIGELKDRIVTLEKSISEKEAALSVLQATTDSIRTTFDEDRKAMTACETSLREANETLSNEVATLRQQLADSQNNVIDARADRDAIDARLDTLRDTLSEVKSNLDVAQAEKALLQKQNEQLLTQRHSTKGKGKTK